MKFALFTILILVLAASCGRESNDAASLNAKEVTLSFSGTKVFVPEHYILVTPSKYKKLIKALPDNIPEIVEKNVAKIDALVEANYIFDIYVDNANANNTIWFMDGPAVRLNKDLVNYFVASTDQRLKNEFEPYGIYYKRIENTFYTGRHNQLLKVKYEVLADGVTTYTTEYLATSLTTCLGVMVNNIANEDYEVLVKNMKME